MNLEANNSLLNSSERITDDTLISVSIGCSSKMSFNSRRSFCLWARNKTANIGKEICRVFKQNLVHCYCQRCFLLGLIKTYG